MSAPDFAAAAPDRAAADLAHEALKLAFSSHRARTIWMARELVMREIPPHALDLETGRLLAPRMAAAGHLHAVPVDPGTLIALGAAAGMVGIVPILGWIAAILVWIATAFLWIIAFLGALQGEKKVVTWVGAYFQQWFKAL